MTQTLKLPAGCVVTPAGEADRAGDGLGIHRRPDTAIRRHAHKFAGYVGMFAGRDGSGTRIPAAHRPAPALPQVRATTRVGGHPDRPQSAARGIGPLPHTPGERKAILSALQGRCLLASAGCLLAVGGD